MSFEIKLQDVTLLNLFRTNVKVGNRMHKVHRHIDFEISTVTKGKGEYTTDTGVFPIEPGDVFLFSTNEQHCITNVSEPLELLTLRFAPRFIWGSGNRMFDFKFLNIFFLRNENFKNRLESSMPSVKKLSELLHGIENEFIENKPEYELMVKVLLLNLLVLLIRDFDYVKETEYTAPKTQNLKSMEKAIEYIDAHYCENFTLEQISRIAAMSRSYFSTTFKYLNGISLWDYITIKKVNKAIELLTNTDKTMLEIATLCGYNNTANFNRAFRKVTKRTPQSYRKEG